MTDQTPRHNAVMSVWDLRPDATHRLGEDLDQRDIASIGEWGHVHDGTDEHSHPVVD